MVEKIKIILIVLFCAGQLGGCAFGRSSRKAQEIDNLQKRFEWWPTDAKPAPVKAEDGGYWWWPRAPGEKGPLWGNRGYCYVYKIIYDYKEEELPPAKLQELRPSLLIKKIIKNVKIYFDYNKASLREDALEILTAAANSLNRDMNASILITGNCDVRGSEAYNEKLGRKRADAVRQFMMEKGISPERIKIISRGKLDAVAAVRDIVGMQKDRNAQFMIAEVEEIMIPAPEPGGDAPPEIIQEALPLEEGKYIVEKEERIESKIKVSFKEYLVKKGQTLWDIAQKELGSGHRWKYLYELNKDKIKNPNKLKAGIKIVIPVE